MSLNPLRLTEIPADQDRKGNQQHPVTSETTHPLDRRVRVIFETCREALLVVDDNQRFLRVNASAARLLGATPQEILGRQIADFTPPEQRQQLMLLWRRFSEDGYLEGNYLVLQGNGARRPVTFRASWHYAHGEHLIAASEADGSQPATAGGHSPLTRREREILQLAAHGYSNPQIAARLFLSPATVKTHLQNIYKKLAASDRAAAVAAALRAGLIS